MPSTLGLYDVVVLPTIAASRCLLDAGKSDKYRLQFVDNGIIFKEKLNSEQNQSWHQLYYLRYDHIRRYGKRTNVFIIEAGRSCETGEGEFRFQSVDADKMFVLFRSTTEDILNRQQQSSSNESPVENGKPQEAENQSTMLKNCGHSEQNDSKDADLSELSPTVTRPLQLSASNSPSDLGSSKDDSHIYAQVQKKRMAPNIPPRGTSLRKPHGTVLNKLMDGNNNLNSTGKESDVHQPPPPPPPPPPHPSTCSTEKREPVYAELVQSPAVHFSATGNGYGNKNRSVKTRCRSPAPLTDNFIRMDGLTQYASVIDFIPPPTQLSNCSKVVDSSSLAQDKQVVINNSGHDSKGKDDNQNDHSGNGNGNGDTFSPAVSSKNQKKKAKTKSKGADKKLEDNKQSSSWFNFFGGNKKTASS